MTRLFAALFNQYAARLKRFTMTQPQTQNKPSRSRFSRDTTGSVSVELIIVLPMLIWALAATAVFFDGFRTRYHAQMAAQTVADIMSRETNLFTANYVEGMNEVFDFLVDRSIPTRIRVSSIIWDSINQRNRLQWSYGTRSLQGLPTSTFELLQADDLETLSALFGAEDSFSFAGAGAQMPVSDLASRIPPVLPGEAMLLVESFALWTPFAGVGLGQMRFNQVVVVRPRFAPWINFDGIDPVFPEASYEIVWTGEGGGTLPDPTDDDTPPQDPGTISNSFDFDSGVTTGWTSSAIATSTGANGRFLGPFGGETYDVPISLALNFGSEPARASVAFDLLILDTWDGYSTTNALPRGDTISILLDGTPISLDAFTAGVSGLYGNPRRASGYLAGMRYQVTMDLRQSGTSFYGGATQDSVWRVEITLANAPRHLTLGLSAGTNSAIADESFGIDNFVYSATADTSGTTYYTADSRLLDGTDTLTRFPRYQGCPEYQIAAPWLSLTNADLSTRLTVPLQASGQRDLSTCTLLRGWGYVGAEPQMVLKYDNQNQTQPGRSLQILLEDGNSGHTCDTVLSIRDPNGQWWYNDDQSGYNAGLQMGSAVSGQYAIWIGTYSPGTCSSSIIFSNY